MSILLFRFVSFFLALLPCSPRILRPPNGDFSFHRHLPEPPHVTLCHISPWFGCDAPLDLLFPLLCSYFHLSCLVRRRSLAARSSLPTSTRSRMPLLCSLRSRNFFPLSAVRTALAGRLRRSPPSKAIWFVFSLLRSPHLSDNLPDVATSLVDSGQSRQPPDGNPARVAEPRLSPD